MCDAEMNKEDPPIGYKYSPRPPPGYIGGYPLSPKEAERYGSSHPFGHWSDSKLVHDDSED